MLLHACCGPCSREPTRLLRERGVEPVIFYANSNIAPAEEYQHRLQTLQDFAASENFEVVEGVYDPQTWEATAGAVGERAHERFGLIADEHAADFAKKKELERSGLTPEELHDYAEAGGAEVSVGNTSEEARHARAARCRACYRLRFEEAARYAAENGFDALGTTLSVSPYQHTNIIKEELERAAAKEGLVAAFEDYRPYYDNATQRSRDAGMYRQNFCGCRFSKEEADAERAVRKVERKARKKAQKREKARLRALEEAAQEGN